MILNRASLFRVLVYTTLTYRSFEHIVKILNPLYRKTLIQIKPLVSRFYNFNRNEMKR